ncbi:MAG: shikimate kinase [Planctomycetaceae bacterium]|nr:shikimate kinase [Planctomycetaceae bacterium]
MTASSFVILTGYRCTGKTTLAALLGKLLCANVLDTDKEIEKKYQTSVSEIFAQKGETDFRNKESEIISEIITNRTAGYHPPFVKPLVKPLVLSTGGGAVIRPENRSMLRENGYVVWLTASPEVILQRLQNDAQTATLRPSLTSLPMLDEIKTLLEIRRPFYEETAHVTINTDEQSPEKIAEIIVEAVNTGNK